MPRYQFEVVGIFEGADEDEAHDEFTMWLTSSPEYDVTQVEYLPAPGVHVEPLPDNKMLHVAVVDEGIVIDVYESVCVLTDANIGSEDDCTTHDHDLTANEGEPIATWAATWSELADLCH